MCYQYHKVYTQNRTHSTIGLHILFNYNQSNHMYSQGRQEGGGGELHWAPTLIGPQLESKSLKLSRFYIKSIFEIEGHACTYSTSTCSLAKVKLGLA